MVGESWGVAGSQQPQITQIIHPVFSILNLKDNKRQGGEFRLGDKQYVKDIHEVLSEGMAKREWNCVGGGI